MAKGGSEYDSFLAETSLENMLEAMRPYKSYFPLGSETGSKTQAASAIWETNDNFEKLVDNFVSDIELALSSDLENAELFSENFEIISKNCRSCHMNYRSRWKIKKLFSGLIFFTFFLGVLTFFLPNWKNIEKDRIVNSEDYVPDLNNGEKIFTIGGCKNCHQNENSNSDQDYKIFLSGGYPFKTNYGIIYSSNISPDPLHGIGKWTIKDFSKALRKGVSPSGSNYYPAFPFTSYSGLSDKDVIDLFYYLKSLPASEEPNKNNDVFFPYSIRSLVTFWKLLNQNKLSEVPEEFEYGRYLVETIGHCGECHTPRKLLGTLDYANLLTGVKKSDFSAGAPDIISPNSNISKWSIEEISDYLQSGFTPDFDSAGGSMAKVIDNLSKVNHEDRSAISSYLKYLQEKYKEK